MSWRRRLAELAAAGGALAACGSDAHGPNFCGNVMPDPCICDRTPLDAGQCVAEAACRDAGGTWLFDPPTGSGYWGHCQLPRLDAGVDAPPLDAPATDAPSD